MDTNTVITRFSYQEVIGNDTEAKVMREFIEQTKEAMVDKVQELEDVLKAMEKEKSPIAKWGVLLEYQQKAPNTGYQVFPVSIYTKLTYDIFSYLKGGELHMRFREPLYVLNPLEFKVSMMEKKITATHTVPYAPEQFMEDHEVMTITNFSMLEALEEYFHGEEKLGLKALYSVLQEKEAETLWREKTGSKEAWRGQKSLSFLEKVKVWQLFRKTIKPQMEELYQGLLDKYENEKEKRKEIETAKQRNQMQKEGVHQLMNARHIHLLLDAFKEEGFEVVLENL